MPRLLANREAWFLLLELSQVRHSLPGNLSWILSKFSEQVTTTQEHISEIFSSSAPAMLH